MDIVQPTESPSSTKHETFSCFRVYTGSSHVIFLPSGAGTDIITPEALWLSNHSTGLPDPQFTDGKSGTSQSL